MYNVYGRLVLYLFVVGRLEIRSGVRSGFNPRRLGAGTGRAATSSSETSSSDSVICSSSLVEGEEDELSGFSPTSDDESSMSVDVEPPTRCASRFFRACSRVLGRVERSMELDDRSLTPLSCPLGRSDTSPRLLAMNSNVG